MDLFADDILLMSMNAIVDNDANIVWIDDDVMYGNDRVRHVTRISTYLQSM